MVTYSYDNGNIAAHNAPQNQIIGDVRTSSLCLYDYKPGGDCC